ncbi:MAG TPA: DUF58 domain-containing protein [Planctomycetota bacterium]|nr:DUF58 domain-containing protein [Planctomycetota bacterium]HRR81495.1 DUF58 domain-containing protein [Planctomycetota bacterium]HRT94365.1 DUF58 domain-containing protein [Planctomycetota bacterium]
MGFFPAIAGLAAPVAEVDWRGVAQAVTAASLLVLLAIYAVSAWRRGQRSLAGQRITRSGVAFSLLTLAAALVALHTKINFLVLLFGMLLSALVLSFALSRATMRRLSFARALPEGVHAGTPFTVELRAANGKRWLASYCLAVRDELPEGLAAGRPGGVALVLRPRETLALSYTATAARRGVYPLRAVTYSTRFPFGLFHQGRSRPVPGELVVYPRLGVVSAELLGRARALALARHRSRGARGEEEFRDLREYRHGDNPRRIHWKTSAKLGKPLVREFESVASERALLLLDTRCPASGDERLEAAISFAASLARDLLHRGFALGLAAYAPDLVVVGPAQGAAGLRLLLEALARLEPAPARTLSELAAEPRVRAQGRLLAILAVRQADDDAAAAADLLRRQQPWVLMVDASAPSFADLFQLRHDGTSQDE